MWTFIEISGGKNLKGKNRGGNLKSKFGGKRKAGDEGQLDGVIDDTGEEEDEEIADSQSMKVD